MVLLNEINDTCVNMEIQIKELIQQKTDTQAENIRIKEDLSRLSDDVASFDCE